MTHSPNSTNSPNNSKSVPTDKKHTMFGRVGAYLGAKYASDKSYQAVDITADFDKVFISTHVKKFAKELFGKRLHTAYTITQKVLPAQTLAKWSDEAYDKVATWVNQWALLTLQKDARFANLPNLTKAQIDDFAQDIINKNRTWLSMGGVFGAFGLKGVVLDTAWFLVMSLRTVYELGHIYGADMSSKDNIRTSYALIAGVDETLVGQKQILLTALAIGQMVLKNAQTTGLADELLALSSNPLTKQYADYLDEVLGWFDMDKTDLDRFNSVWLCHLCSLASVGVSVHYNNQIFDEIVGVAKATFGRDDRVKLIENA